MTRFQKVFCVILSLCFFAVLAMAPEWLFLGGNIYRQLPLYRFLEEKARSMSQRDDPETYELLVENNIRYLERQIEEENRISGQEYPEENAETADRHTQEAGEENGMEQGESKEQAQSTSAPTESPEKAETNNKAGQDASRNTPENRQKENSAEQEEKKEQEKNTTRPTESPEKAETNNEAGQDASRNTPENRQKENGAEQEEKKEQEQNTTRPTENPEESEANNKAGQPGSEGQKPVETEDTSAAQTAASALPHPEIDLAPETLADYDYLLNNFFIVDPKTSTSAQQLNAAAFLAEDLSLEKTPDAPQILIYHSHSQETFADSREGRVEDTIVGVGDYLTQLLTEKYGYQVIHIAETFDLIDGELDRSAAYDYARPYIEQVLAENPTVEVVIDLHRDGVPEDRRLVTEINGKPTAQIMFYNGLSYTAGEGQVSYLPNPYIQDNLAFSFQLEYQAAQYYPKLYRGIYLAALRYNLHLKPRALLLEAGAQTNTVQEVKNAMEPFADILNRVLAGD